MIITSTGPVPRQDSSPELTLINEIKNYDLKILIIEDIELDIILDEHLP